MMKKMRKSKVQTIDDYISTFPDDVQAVLGAIRRTIKKSAPQAVEAISYRIPTFKLNGNLVHFAAFKNHVGFYPGPSGIKAFKTELSSYKWSKGSVQFPLEKPVPFDLIKKIVAYRVKENLEKVKRA
jgi:uncharacterized protein YdhG (YjbR/CyaY superfamily)